MCGDESRAYRIEVRGLVQGVGFRAFVVRAAAENRIVGSVRNKSDGGVEIEAQGRAAELERFLLAVREGPRMARVDDMRVETTGPLGASSFEIRW